MTTPNAALRLFFPHSRRGLFVLCASLLAGCFGSSPTSLNQQIDDGNATEALTKAEAALADSPTGEEAPQYALIAAKARIALCVQRQCTVGAASNTVPPLLTPLNALLTQAANARIPGDDKKAPPYTLTTLLTWAMTQFETLPNQPLPILTLADAAPTTAQPQLTEGFFAPALSAVKAGNATQAGHILLTLADAGTNTSTLAEPLPTLARFQGNLLAGNISGSQPYLIALRSSSASSTLPRTATHLLAWSALMASSTTPDITHVPETLTSWKIPLFKTFKVETGMAQAFSQMAGNLPPAFGRTAPSATRLALQRLSLTLNPNQPGLWASYLKDLTQNAALFTPTSSTLQTQPNLLTSGFVLGNVTSETAVQLGNELLATARTLQNTPAVAAPLLVLATQLPLSNPQQVQLDKLGQDLILKAAEKGDIATTLTLAQAKPQVAQNNRHIVVPLLVQGVRHNLQTSKFDEATSMADILTKTLHLNIEYGPIILEEFTADIQKRGLIAQLNAETPTTLLQPYENIQLNLGPIFHFMQSYFANQPDVINSQLTTLVAQATGPYGPANAMYRLGSSFPSSTMPLEKQQAWLGTALTSALLSDDSLTPPATVKLASQLTQLHPQFRMASALDAAVRKAQTLEDQRELWHASSPEVRALFQSIRPQFEALMRGIDAMEKGRLSTASEAFEMLADPQTRQLAAPYIEQFLRRLAVLSGVYVPQLSSGNPTIGAPIPAAIILSPAAIGSATPGALNAVSVTLISPIGRAAELATDTFRTSHAEAHRLTLSVPFTFETQTLALTPDVLSQSPQGLSMAHTYGALSSLKLTSSGQQPALRITRTGGKPLTYVRMLANPSAPLIPDGIYLLKSRLGTPPSDTATILPPGTLVQLQTSISTRPAQPEDDAPTAATTIYPTTGYVQHPANPNAIPLTGVFDPFTLTTTFTFTYPLPQSARPVKAEVRCQTLGGRILCGAHHTHSPREAFATLTAGFETVESQRANATQRATLNTVATQAMLTLPQAPTTPSPSDTPVTPTTPLPTAPNPPTPTPAEQTSPSTPVSPSLSSTLPPPGAFIHKSISGTIISTTLPTPSNTEPGKFIHRITTSSTPLF